MDGRIMVVVDGREIDCPYWLPGSFSWDLYQACQDMQIDWDVWNHNDKPSGVWNAKNWGR